MPSHMSSIGLPVSGPGGVGAIAERVVHSALPIEAEGGRYMEWTGESGAQVVLQYDPAGALIGANPHFAGAAKLRVGLTDATGNPEGSPLDGRLEGWADPPADDPTTGIYPIVVDCPVAASARLLELPAIVELQVAAFAHEIETWPTVGEYTRGRSGVDAAMASRSFVPVGMFGPQGEPGPARPYAVLTGHVTASGRKINEVTGAGFIWALVDGLGGSFDVVEDPALLPEPPAAGGVVAGTFWLSGRIAPPRA